MTEASPTGRGRMAAIATLLVLAPVVGEVLSGATRLSFIFALVPEIMVWGCGTLLIREAVRRFRGRGTSALLLGLGLAIAEEFVIQQTSIAPLPWLAGAPEYGRALGVNWPYFLFMLGYESVFVVLVPILLSELLFPERRDEPWLRPGGIAIAALVFVFGSFVAWFLWTQQARPNVFHVPVYHPPAVTIGSGVLAIALLAVAAPGARGIGRATSPRPAPPAWVLVLVALGFGFPWYLLMTVVFAPRADLPLWIPIAGAAAWAIAAYATVFALASTTGFGDGHRWALAFGAMLVSMLAGFLGSESWPRADVVAKVVLDVAAVGGMAWLRVRIGRRAPLPTRA